MSTLDLQNGKFRFAVIGEAEGNEREIFSWTLALCNN